MPLQPVVRWQAVWPQPMEVNGGAEAPKDGHDSMGKPVLEQSVLEGLQPLERTRAGAVHEGLQPCRRDLMLEQGKSVRSPSLGRKEQQRQHVMN